MTWDSVQRIAGTSPKERTPRGAAPEWKMNSVLRCGKSMLGVAGRSRKAVAPSEIPTPLSARSRNGAGTSQVSEGHQDSAVRGGGTHVRGRSGTVHRRGSVCLRLRVCARALPAGVVQLGLGLLVPKGGGGVFYAILVTEILLVLVTLAAIVGGDGRVTELVFPVVILVLLSRPSARNFFFDR